MSSYGLDLLPPEIAARIVIDPETGCWLYGGYRDDDEYASASWGGSKTRSAHRLVFELLVGPIPPGLHLDHVRKRGCQYKNCCWPRHLEPVTNAENQRRRAEFNQAKRDIQQQAEAWQEAARPACGESLPAVYSPRPCINLSGLDALSEIFAGL